MIDIRTERVFPLSELPGKAAAMHPDGKKLSLSSLYRWAADGIHGVRLETVMVGGARHSSLEAYVRFVANVTTARDGRPAADSSSPAPQS
jgi:hypothetical protein